MKKLKLGKQFWFGVVVAWVVVSMRYMFFIDNLEFGGVLGDLLLFTSIVMYWGVIFLAISKLDD